MILHVQLDEDNRPVLVHEDPTGVAPIPDGMVAMTIEQYNDYLQNNTPPQNLTLFKEDARRTINQIRDQKESSSFPYLGTRFDSDSRSILRILAVVNAAQLALANDEELNIEWTDAFNNQVSLTATDIIGMPAAMVVYAHALHQAALEAKSQVEEATSIEEIELIVQTFATNG